MKGRARLSLGAVILLALLLMAEGTVIFHNNGTKSGWDSINQEHEGIVSEVTNIVYNGPTAIKVQQTYDPSYTGRYHSEVVKRGVYRRGDSGFYGFAFRLKADWEFDDQTYNIAQFITDWSDYGCVGYSPTTMVWLRGNQLYSRVKYGQVCPKSSQRDKTFSNLTTVSAGKWHKVEIGASWQSNNTGHFELWYDGKKVLQQLNLATTLPDSRPIDFRVGLYANGWHDDGLMKGSQGVRQVWYDQIGAGTAFADADPDKWSSSISHAELLLSTIAWN